MILKEQQTMNNVMKTGHILANRLIVNAFEMNRIEGMINLLTAGTGVGKTYSSMTRLIPLMIKEGTTKFILTTPLVDSAKSTMNDFKKLRKKIERGLETDLVVDEVSVEYTSNIDEFLNSFVNPKQICVLITNHDTILNTPNLEEMKNRNRIKKYRDIYLSHNQLAIIVDEIHYGGSTESATTKFNTGSDESKYRAAMINFLATMVSDSWIIGITATLIHEMLGLYGGVIRALLDHPDIFNVCTSEEDAPTHEELTRILSNYKNTYWVDEDDVVETAVEYFEAMRSSISSKAEILSSHFPELEFDPKIVCMITCSYGSRNGKPTKQDGFNVPIHEAYEKVAKITRSLGQDEDTFIMIETTEDGAILRSISNETREVASDRVEGILNGTDLDYHDVRYLFVVEKFKMSMNVPRLSFYASARERKSAVLSHRDSNGKRICVTVTIRQLLGRTVRPFYGLKLGENTIFGKDAYSPEDIYEVIYTKYNSHPKFGDLLEYIKICNSHSFVLPRKQQFEQAVEEWSKSFSASIELSMFQDENELKKINSNTIEIHTHEDGEECPTCGKPGYLPNLEDVFEKVLFN